MRRLVFSQPFDHFRRQRKTLAVRGGEQRAAGGIGVHALAADERLRAASG